NRMGRLRRSLFGIIAAFAMICGLGWTAAAYACPEPATAQPADDGCKHSQPVNSVIPYWGPICLGVVPATPAIDPVAVIHPPPYIMAIPMLHGYVHAPDPPPPRAA